MKTLQVNQKAKEVFKNYDVPEHLHNLTLGLIICITSDVNRKLDKAKLIVDSEKLKLSKSDIKLAESKALSILYN
jgi:hypothetical protein|tara:strand:- start:275 stop:499 length:225 start_codon:yes stop_codon:yes gene_type:complete